MMRQSRRGIQTCSAPLPSGPVLAQDAIDILGLDTLLAQLILGLGLALLAGNGYAIYMNRKGRAPKGAEGEFRPGRAYWLLGVGVLIAIWGAASLFTG